MLSVQSQETVIANLTGGFTYEFKVNQLMGFVSWISYDDNNSHRYVLGQVLVMGTTQLQRR